jgi:hypothetical protein
MNKAPAILLALALATTAAAIAKTATGSVGVSVQLVNGSTVSAYLVGNDLTTTVGTGTQDTALPAGAAPVIRVGFDLQHSWTLVKRVTWDKARKHLTIDF